MSRTSSLEHLYHSSVVVTASSGARLTPHTITYNDSTISCDCVLITLIIYFMYCTDGHHQYYRKFKKMICCFLSIHSFNPY